MKKENLELDIYYTLKSRSGKKRKILAGKSIRYAYSPEMNEELMQRLTEIENEMKTKSREYLTDLHRSNGNQESGRNKYFMAMRHFVRRFCTTWRSTYYEMLNL